MKIAIVGTGYVGLVTGACFAEMGNKVWCIDVNRTKINALNNGEIPIYEPGLSDLVKRNRENGNLNFTTDLKDCISEVSLVFSAVGTPPDEDGSADLTYVLQVAKRFGELIDHEAILVTKSTVPVGTADKVYKAVKAEIDRRRENGEFITFNFHVASNPEFLKEGSAINDFMHPDRVVVGASSDFVREQMTALYRPFMLVNDRLIITDIRSAEMIKYAANSMLATRISFMNDIANLCDIVGANVEDVRKGIGSDTRIGSKFLYSGCGYGGSCFPKDVKALIRTGEERGYSMNVIKAVEETNEFQKTILFRKLSKNIFGSNDFSDKHIAVLGLAFKPETDDMREATSVVLIKDLLAHGCKNIYVYDPIAMNECKRIFGENESIIYCKDLYEASTDADAIVLVTEWKEFRSVDWERLASIVKHKNLVDGRNVYNRSEVEAWGFKYLGIGK